MSGVLEGPNGQPHRVISVELSDRDNAEHLAQELTDLFPAATIEHDGLLDVAVYGVGAENRLVVEVLGAVQLWLRKRGTEPVRVRFGKKTQFGGKTYLLEASA
jgi:hypothetical protein